MEWFGVFFVKNYSIPAAIPGILKARRTPAGLGAMGQDPVERMCNVFTKINDRYEEVKMATGWREEPSVQALYKEFTGGLVDGVGLEELGLMRGEVLEVWEKHNHMIAQQLRQGYRPRTIDVVFSLVCWEAVIRLSTGGGR